MVGRKHPEERALAGTVLAHHRPVFSLAHRPVEVLEHCRVAELDVDVFEVKEDRAALTSGDCFRHAPLAAGSPAVLAMTNRVVFLAAGSPAVLAMTIFRLSSLVSRLSSQINNLVVLQFRLRVLGFRGGTREFSCVLRKSLFRINERRNFGQQFVFAGKAHGKFHAGAFRQVHHARRQVATEFRIEATEQVVEVNPFRLFHPHARKQHTAQFAVRKA